jgi:hypothetical protein
MSSLFSLSLLPSPSQYIYHLFFSLFSSSLLLLVIFLWKTLTNLSSLCGSFPLNLDWTHDSLVSNRKNVIEVTLCDFLCHHRHTASAFISGKACFQNASSQSPATLPWEKPRPGPWIGHVYLLWSTAMTTDILGLSVRSPTSPPFKYKNPVLGVVCKQQLMITASVLLATKSVYMTYLTFNQPRTLNLE